MSIGALPSPSAKGFTSRLPFAPFVFPHVLLSKKVCPCILYTPSASKSFAHCKRWSVLNSFGTPRLLQIGATDFNVNGNDIFFLLYYTNKKGMDLILHRSENETNRNYEMLQELLNKPGLLNWLLSFTETPESADFLLMLLKLLHATPVQMRSVALVHNVLSDTNTRSTLARAYYAWKSSRCTFFPYQIDKA